MLRKCISCYLANWIETILFPRNWEMKSDENTCSQDKKA